MPYVDFWICAIILPITIQNATQEKEKESMKHEKWSCPKCSNDEFETDIFQATGGTFAKLFDVQNKKFTTVSCTRCQYTEIYKADTSRLGNIFDFFTS